MQHKSLQHWQNMLASGALKRREFIKLALAAGLSAGFASQLANTAQAATPSKGGRLRQALTGGGTGDVLDPAQTLDSYMINVSFGQLRNCLTEIAPDGSLIGELAESWESSPDAKEWTFKLRQGVEFHNGKSLDANDVVASLNHHRGEDSKSAAKGLVDPITDVKADGNDTVVVTLSGGSADFPFLMSDYHLTICPAKDDGSMDWESGIGTGAFSLVSFDPGVRTVVKRNPNYWKSDRAFFDEVETLFVADVNARTSALQSGDLDVMTNVDLKTVSLLKRAAGVNIIETTGNRHFTLPMDTRAAPFDNNDVRLALKYAIDREAWLQKILRGHGELGNDSPVGPANQYRASAEELPQRAYDPDKAKYHLKQAGMDTLAVKLHLAETAFEGAVDAGVLFRESAAAAGIDIEVVREANDGYWSNVWMKKPWVASYWGGRPTEDWIFSQIYAAEASWNEAFWKNDRFNELLVQARAELDSAKRREMYVEMQKIVNEDGGSIIPLYASYVAAATDKVQHPEQLANNWELDGHKNTERWWFAG